MELTPELTKLAMRVTKEVKKAVKKKQGPSGDTLLRLAKGLGPSGNVKEAASTVLAHALPVVDEASGGKLKIDTASIARLAASHSDGDFVGFLDDVISELPLDPAVKLLASSLVDGGDDD